MVKSPWRTDQIGKGTTFRTGWCSSISTNGPRKPPPLVDEIALKEGGFSGGPIWDPPGYPKIFFALRAKSPKNLTLPLKTRKIFFALRARNVPKTTIYPWKPPKFSARFARKKAIDLPLEIRKSSKFSSRFARNIIKNIDLPFKINGSFRAKRADFFYNTHP